MRRRVRVRQQYLMPDLPTPAAKLNNWSDLGRGPSRKASARHSVHLGAPERPTAQVTTAATIALAVSILLCHWDLATWLQGQPFCPVKRPVKSACRSWKVFSTMSSGVLQAFKAATAIPIFSVKLLISL